MRGRLLAAMAIVALVAVGCGLEGDDAPTTLDVVTSGFAFEGVPDSFRGGPVEINFRNNHTVPHELALIDIGDASVDDFKREFPALLEGGPFPDFFERGTVPIEAEPGQAVSTTASIPTGSYLLFCALTDAEGEEDEGSEGPPHYELGMLKQVTVEEGNGELPPGDGAIVAKDYTYELPELGAGSHELVFRNDGPDQWHHFVAMEFPEGVDEQGATEAFEAMLAAGEDAPPPAGPEPEEIGFGGVLSPGMAQTVQLDLRSGHTYLFVCFIQDTTGGPPHAVAHQMFKTFSVT